MSSFVAGGVSSSSHFVCRMLSDSFLIFPKVHIEIHWSIFNACIWTQTITCEHCHVSVLSRKLADAAQQSVEKQFNPADWYNYPTMWQEWLLRSALVTWAQCLCRGRATVMSVKRSWGEQWCARVEGQDASRSLFKIATWDSGAARHVCGRRVDFDTAVSGWSKTVVWVWKWKWMIVAVGLCSFSNLSDMYVY